MDWMEVETTSHEFTVLILCGGGWCQQYEDYLTAINDIVFPIRAMNGDIFCVAQQGPKRDIIGPAKLRVYRDALQEISKLYYRAPSNKPLPLVVIVGKDKDKVLFRWEPHEDETSLAPKHVLQFAKLMYTKK
ncbi:hypothetical protein AKO1_011846 [Acrasis kona]|uniref:Uncharacterized protein n=1 Tax=Acrasis kona TaxID=1008807 RepID=A0AAW2Z846_9EUKA